MQERHTVRVTDVDYDDSGELVVKLCGRSEDGERVAVDVYGTEPYLFIPEQADDPFDNRYLADKVKEVNDVDDNGQKFESYDNKPLKQVVTNVPKQVPKVRENYEQAWESDVPYVRRCTADYDLSGYINIPKEDQVNVNQVRTVSSDSLDFEIEPRTLFIDIEVRVPDEFHSDFAEDAENEVTAITSYDNYDEEYTLFALDPDLEIEPGEIRDHIEENWEGHEDQDEMTDIDIVFKRYGNEVNLLNGFAEYVSEKQPDVMTGWNYISFDHKYLVNRMFKLNGCSPQPMSDIGRVGGRRTDTIVDGVPAIDMMKALCGKLTYGRWESQALDYVANEILGVGKVEGDDVNFDRNRTKFMAYNIVDVQLCVEMDKVRNVMQFWFLLAEVCAIPPYEVGTTMKECEGFLFKHRESDEILPDTDPDEMNTISGGFVMPPHKGVEDWVGVFDLKSLYPSSIITCNISKETMTYDEDEADVIVPNMPLNYEKVAGDKILEKDIGWEMGEGACVGFDLSEQGILPKYLKLLFKNREQMKRLRDEHEKGTSMYESFDQQQRAIKVVMNSFFGVSDNPYFRLSQDGLGAAITSVSRLVSWGGVQIIEDEGYDVLYGDTDSLMVSLLQGEKTPDEFEDTDEVIPYMEDLEQEINGQLDFVADMVGIPDDGHPLLEPGELHGTDRHLWHYEAEKLYRRFLQAGTKKRYAGNIKWKEGKKTDDTDTVGFETEKSDATVLTQEVQKRFIEMALAGKDYEEMTEYIQEVIRKLENDEYTLQEVAFPSSISKPLKDYPNRPVKRACQFSNEYLGHDWRSGDSPWLVYVDRTPPRYPNVDVIAIEWTADSLPEDFEMNTTKHVSKAIEGPIKSVLPAFDFSWREVKTGRREQSFLGEAADDNPTDTDSIFDQGPATEDPFADAEEGDDDD